jgi:hypothetical protein
MRSGPALREILISHSRTRAVFWVAVTIGGVEAANPTRRIIGLVHEAADSSVAAILTVSRFVAFGILK